MMLRFSFELEKEADDIENAVNSVLNNGFRTADIVGTSDVTPVTTSQMTEKILENI